MFFCFKLGVMSLNQSVTLTAHLTTISRVYAPRTTLAQYPYTVKTVPLRSLKQSHLLTTTKKIILPNQKCENAEFSAHPNKINICELFQRWFSDIIILWSLEMFYRTTSKTYTVLGTTKFIPDKFTRPFTSQIHATKAAQKPALFKFKTTKYTSVIPKVTLSLPWTNLSFWVHSSVLFVFLRVHPALFTFHFLLQ